MKGTEINKAGTEAGDHQRAGARCDLKPSDGKLLLKKQYLNKEQKKVRGSSVPPWGRAGQGGCSGES